MPADEIEKEPAYFSIKGCATGRKKYLDLFRQAEPGHKMIGEASTAYLTDPESSAKIHRFSPDAKIIIMLRNPVDRAYSLYRWMVQEGYEYAESFEEALDLEYERIGKTIPNWFEPEYYWNYLYFNSGLYHDQVKRYLDLFGDRVCLVKSEDFRENPHLEYVKICTFLGLMPATISPKVYNESSRVHSATIQFVLRKTVDGLEAKNIEIHDGKRAEIMSRIVLGCAINGVKLFIVKKRMMNPLLTLMAFRNIFLWIAENKGKDLPKKIRRDALLQAGLKRCKDNTLSAGLRNKLARNYAQDIAKLEKLTNMRFDHWLARHE